MKIAITDTETTGFRPPKALLLEIAAVVTDSERIYDDVDWIHHWWSVYVDQSANLQNFDYGAMSVNHITPGHTKGGVTMQHVRKRLAEYDIIACHNMPFDAQFFPDDLNAKYICTLACAKKIWPDVSKHQNMYLRYQLGIVSSPPYWTNSQMNEAHRALPDCITTANLLRHMLVEKGHSIEELIGWSPQPAPGVAK